MPKISIVIPAYNVGDYLQECLDSVRNQTFSDIEAIVVNDASPDNVGEIAARAATEDPRIRVITNNPNMGTHRTRMAGVENASGEYTFFLDGDDALKPDMCEQLAAEICTQAIADDRNILLIDDIHQLAHLSGSHEVAFIDNHAVIPAQVNFAQFFHKAALRHQPAAGTHNVRSIPIFEFRLEHEHILPALSVIILHHDRVSRLARPHRAISEIELRHLFVPPVYSHPLYYTFPVCF